VHTRLAVQQIFFPRANSQAVAAPARRDAKYGGQQLAAGQPEPRQWRLDQNRGARTVIVESRQGEPVIGPEIAHREIVYGVTASVSEAPVFHHHQLSNPATVTRILSSGHPRRVPLGFPLSKALT
jgi:hypothetical protein